MRMSNILITIVKLNISTCIINNHAAFACILECPDHGEASSAGGTVLPGVAGLSGLNIKQTHHDQGIQLAKSVMKPV